MTKKAKPDFGPVHKTLEAQNTNSLESQRENLLLCHMGHSFVMFSDLHQKLADYCASTTRAILELKSK